MDESCQLSVIRKKLRWLLEDYTGEGGTRIVGVRSERSEISFSRKRNQ
jgi:hypothetical protein